ncbi:MAG: M17 family peptidase N-terminal domain-containing protein [Myxococcota bacterium]|nr:M17 family peptidase N-terminal domain-containing protein [Myxococcota bacterium]
MGRLRAGSVLVSRELRIEVDVSSVERARADVVAVPLFADERPLRGGAGRADWRLCGKLSELVKAGRLGGEPGEAALVATFGGLRVPLLMVLGAGPREGFDVARFQGLVADAVRRAMALEVRRLALPFPEDSAGGVAQERRVAALVAGATEAVAAAPDPVELEVQVLVPREEATRAADLLRRAQPGRVTEAVSLRLGAARRGGSTANASPRETQLVE